MPADNVNYKNSNTTLGFSHTDLIQLLVPREFFSQGGLYSWGAGTDGALGDGTTTSRSSPGILSAMGETSWQNVSMKGRSGAAIRSDGTLWTWGRGNYGVLGYSSTTARSSPGTLSGAGTTWEEVDAATGHMLAVKNDGTLWSWGRNANGQLGTGNTTNRSSPGTTVGSLGTGGDWRVASAGGENSAAIKIDGTLYTWGDNVSGQLGDGSSTDRSSPATVAGGGTNWEKVAVSNLSGAGAWMAAIKTDGTLWTWGGNNSGQLGNGVSTTSRSSPNTVAGGGTTWYQVACGYSHAVATKTDGTLWTWGSNTGGALGVAGAARSSPDSVSGGGTTWKSVGAGNAISAGIKFDGTLWTWGSNTNGQLGEGTTTNKSSPGTVSGGLNNWAKVSLSATTTSGNMVGVNEVDLYVFPQIDVYTTPGTYTETIPEGQHTAIAEVWGGGGGGGDGYTSPALSGGAGGSGGYARSYLNVTFQVNKTMNVVVGAGGSNPGGDGLDGSPSSITGNTYSMTTMTGNQGTGGTAADPGLSTNGTPGTTGTGSGGTDYNSSGAMSRTGRNGFVYGTGGAGGPAGGGGVTSTPGVAGSDGAVIITYL